MTIIAHKSLYCAWEQKQHFVLVRSILKTLLCWSIFMTSAIGSTTTPLSETQTKLKQLENKITLLEQTLHVVHNKRKTLDNEIENTENEIGNTIRQLSLIQRNISEKQEQLQVVNQLIDTLNHQKMAQRELLAKHIRARYKIGEFQSIDLLLNQKDPYTQSRILTYYQYLLTARLHTMNQVVETETRLSKNQQKLYQEAQKQRLLKNQVTQHQTQLNSNILFHTTRRKSLDEELQNKQQKIGEYQHNKGSLSLLIQNLAQRGLTNKRHHSFPKHRHLPKPVNTQPENIKPYNQGVTFFAEEGAPVVSVYPGKIVFSDWLKGYGLLMIIDHGAGYMTLYAHNQALLKQKGETVFQGEKIATVGHTGRIRKSGLYFEVRDGAKAIPPLEWLA